MQMVNVKEDADIVSDGVGEVEDAEENKVNKPLAPGRNVAAICLGVESLCKYISGLALPLVICEQLHRHDRLLPTSLGHGCVYGTDIGW